jgi:hypothetical protein
VVGLDVDVLVEFLVRDIDGVVGRGVVLVLAGPKVSRESAGHHVVQARHGNGAVLDRLEQVAAPE